MKNLSIRKNNDFGFGLFDGLENFFRPWFTDDFPMRTDIQETDTGYILDIDLPGFDKKDIDITLDNGYIRITAEKDEQANESRGTYLRRERKYGSVTRSYYVGDVKEEDITATFNNGVLALSFPKQSKGKDDNKKRIQIN